MAHRDVQAVDCPRLGAKLIDVVACTWTRPSGPRWPSLPVGAVARLGLSRHHFAFHFLERRPGAVIAVSVFVGVDYMAVGYLVVQCLPFFIPPWPQMIEHEHQNR